jgi:hypothetical protein
MYTLYRGNAMKIFIKWWKKESQKRNTNYWDSMEAWKAALRWALRTAEQLEREDAPVFMNDLIREELKNE